MLLTNYHTHSTFCDGADTPEAVVLSAIEKGFDAIGFSGHGVTPFDMRYCMHDPADYRGEIRRLQAAYGKKIQIYLGTEEEMFCPIDRAQYDYMLGSCHYICKDGKYTPIDSALTYFNQCLALFDGDPLALADNYYSVFCEYILKRKPDIVGHFDLITKFEEVEPHGYFTDPAYKALAEKYLLQALKSDCLFEVNTGAISRGYRTTPYPTVDLLHIMKKNGAKIVLSADSHAADTIDCHFAETRALLKDVGFTHLYALYNGEFVRDPI